MVFQRIPRPMRMNMRIWSLPDRERSCWSMPALMDCNREGALAACFMVLMIGNSAQYGAYGACNGGSWSGCWITAGYVA
jgi:hypothetical protein